MFQQMFAEKSSISMISSFQILLLIDGHILTMGV